MSLVISLGSNVGDSKSYLDKAKTRLCAYFKITEHSRVYLSPAVDYLNQPDFLNQVLVFKTPELSPTEVLKIVLAIEKDLGRVRNIDKGPRTIDIDILFWNLFTMTDENLIIPHPRLFERSFIVKPLQELEIINYLSREFSFPQTFTNTAMPIE